MARKLQTVTALRFSWTQWKKKLKENSALLVAARVRDVCECSKPQCVHAATKLSYMEHTQVQRVREEGVFSCGVSLFHDTHPL